MRVGIVATVLLTGACEIVDGDNHAPKMEPLSLTTEEDKGLRFKLLATDEDGDDLRLTFVGPSAGSLDLQFLWVSVEDGTTRVEPDISFRPDSDYSGGAGFTVHVWDGTVRTDAWISIEVMPVNDRPTAAADSFATGQNTPLMIFHSTLLANDFDKDDMHADEPTLLSIASVEAAVNGTVTFGGDTLTFVPDTNFAGTATFEYTLSDGTKSDVATVMIAVGAPNTAPVAKDDVQQTFAGIPLVLASPALTENDFDIDGQTLTVVAVGNANHGTVQVTNGVVTFTPEDDFYGDASFEYTVSDGAATDIGRVEVQIVVPI